MTDLSNPIFHDATKAREYLEAVRWPVGPFCPHCGDTENTCKLTGKSHRPGLHYCRSCRKQFTVTVGTLFERSHIPEVNSATGRLKQGKIATRRYTRRQWRAILDTIRRVESLKDSQL